LRRMRLFLSSGAVQTGLAVLAMAALGAVMLAAARLVTG